MRFTRLPPFRNLEKDQGDYRQGTCQEHALLPHRHRARVKLPLGDDLLLQSFRHGDLFELCAHRRIKGAVFLEPLFQLCVALAPGQRLGKAWIGGISRTGTVQPQYFFYFTVSHFASCCDLPAPHGSVFPATARCRGPCATSRCRSAHPECPQFLYTNNLQDRKAPPAPDKFRPPAPVPAARARSPTDSPLPAITSANPRALHPIRNVENAPVFGGSLKTRDAKS